jgi:hypothetical protein
MRFQLRSNFRTKMGPGFRRSFIEIFHLSVQTAGNTRFGQQHSRDGITRWPRVLFKPKQIGAGFAVRNTALKLSDNENSFGFTGLEKRTNRWRVTRANARVPQLCVGPLDATCPMHLTHGIKN